jgi:hypothetical protein
MQVCIPTALRRRMVADAVRKQIEEESMKQNRSGRAGGALRCRSGGVGR